MCTMTLNKNDHEGKGSGKRSAPKTTTGKGTSGKSAGDVTPGTNKLAKIKVDLN